MRYSRQSKILELIEEYDVATQEALADLLRSEGYEVTQATVSRDIKDLHLVKILSPAGGYKYAAEASQAAPISKRLSKIFRETIKSVIPAENLIIVKTLSGCGNAAAEAIDSMGLPHVVGSIAGDNTIFLACDSTEGAAVASARISELIR
ncbi:MAG: arginine repressor [Firmicutes bacterium]|nr:arginine repressor [Bacillota bacterium]